MFHSKILFILLLLIIPIALYLGIMLPMMGVVSIHEVLATVYVGSSAVIMLYFVILATVLVNRDYSSNTYRILVGMGVGRIKIFLSKFLIFLITGIAIVVLHGVVASIFPFFNYTGNLKWSDCSTVFLYLIVYGSILSIMFLLAIVGRTIIKSIVCNVAFLTSISILSMIPFNYVQALPLQFLQVVAKGQNEQYIGMVLASLAYMLIASLVSYSVFEKQEL